MSQTKKHISKVPSLPPVPLLITGNQKCSPSLRSNKSGESTSSVLRVVQKEKSLFKRPASSPVQTLIEWLATCQAYLWLEPPRTAVGEAEPRGAAPRTTEEPERATRAAAPRSVLNGLIRRQLQNNDTETHRKNVKGNRGGVRGGGGSDQVHVPRGGG